MVLEMTTTGGLAWEPTDNVVLEFGGNNGPTWLGGTYGLAGPPS